MKQNRLFERYIGIDYSGAETPTTSLKGLRVYSAKQGDKPLEVQPPPGPRKYWTRKVRLWFLELKPMSSAIYCIALKRTASDVSGNRLKRDG